MIKKMKYISRILCLGLILLLLTGCLPIQWKKEVSRQYEEMVYQLVPRSIDQLTSLSKKELEKLQKSDRPIVSQMAISWEELKGIGGYIGIQKIQLVEANNVIKGVVTLEYTEGIGYAKLILTKEGSLEEFTFSLKEPALEMGLSDAGILGIWIISISCISILAFIIISKKLVEFNQKLNFLRKEQLKEPRIASIVPLDAGGEDISEEELISIMTAAIMAYEEDNASGKASESIEYTARRVRRRK